MRVMVLAAAFFGLVSPSSDSGTAVHGFFELAKSAAPSSGTTTASVRPSQPPAIMLGPWSESEPGLAGPGSAYPVFEGSDQAAVRAGKENAVPKGLQAQPIPAKVQFGFVLTPSTAPTRSIGSYAQGCLARAVALPVDGPAWQVMRLSRNRNWGTPELVSFRDRAECRRRKA
jgi:Penicillin-insensitive murein endopeptidase